MERVLTILLFFRNCLLVFDSKLERSAPFLMYPIATSVGIAASVAFPVANSENNLFVSYNFEINYNVVNTASESFPGPLKRLKLASKGARKFQKSFTSVNKLVATRTGVYHVIENILNA